MTKNFFIALDLELNQPSNKIIQAGVALGHTGMSFDEYITRKWYLDPGEPLAEHITNLTGITQVDIAEKAVDWNVMVLELTALLEEYRPFVNPVTWGGGDTHLFLTQAAEQRIEFTRFGRRHIDVKTWHTLIALAQGKSASGGLRSVMSRYGLTFKGAPHRADVDAANTLALFFKLLERQSLLETMAQLGGKL
jgi:inhibitor of KinA sporulation pathway (predicted exonuclease)